MILSPHMHTHAATEPQKTIQYKERYFIYNLT